MNKSDFLEFKKKYWERFRDWMVITLNNTWANFNRSRSIKGDRFSYYSGDFLLTDNNFSNLINGNKYSYKKIIWIQLNGLSIF